jgi:predicted nucleic acid-binding protein
MITCSRTDFINAAKLKNRCRSKGVQAGSIDFLIAAVCIDRNYFLLSADKDFVNIARHCPLLILRP